MRNLHDLARGLVSLRFSPRPYPCSHPGGMPSPSPGSGANSDDSHNVKHQRSSDSAPLGVAASVSGGSTQDLSRDLDELTLASADSGKASRLETEPSKRASEAPQELAPKLAPELNVEGW